MKNQVTINSNTTVATPTQKFQIKVSPFAFVMILAIIGIAILALNGLEYWLAYMWFVPMAGLLYTEAKDIFSMDFNFDLDDDITEEIYKELQNR